MDGISSLPLILNRTLALYLLSSPCKFLISQVGWQKSLGCSWNSGWPCKKSRSIPFLGFLYSDFLEFGFETVVDDLLSNVNWLIPLVIGLFNISLLSLELHFSPCCGEAILFEPTAILGFKLNGGDTMRTTRLGTEFIKIRVRNRLTADGGKSVMTI